MREQMMATTQNWNCLDGPKFHYYKKTFARRFEMGLRGGQKYEPPRLMSGINRGGRFLLTATVTLNHLIKSIYEGGYKISAS